MSSSCIARSECVCATPAKGVLDCTELGNNLARVDTIYGDALGYSVGDTIFARPQSGSGGHVLVPISEHDDGGHPLATLKVEADGGYACRSSTVSDAPALTPAQYADAVTSSDMCSETLTMVDAAWGQSCKMPVDAARVGCSVGGADLGLLFALVAALVRRRSR